MAFRTCESLDANIILRLVLGDAPEKSMKVQDLLMRQDAVYNVADLAIVEVVSVMQSKGISRSEIVDGLRKVFELPNLNANFNLFNQVFPMYLRNESLSFGDCCLSVYAALNEAEPLWTFDKVLAKQSPTAKIL